MSRPIESLTEVIRTPPAANRRLVVTNRTQPAPIQRLLESSFEGQAVGVDEVEALGDAEDVVLLVRDGEVVASSPLGELMDSYLLVNSDQYRTGGIDLDTFELPAVLTDLDETTFEVAGYPATSKGKFIFVAMSRQIEVQALRAGRGTLRSTFQHLSRIDDEAGTRGIYRALSETDLDVHAYGAAGQVPDEVSVTTHVGDHDGYRRSWCVVYTPPPGATGHTALVAVETGSNEWLGTWTYRPELVERAETILADEF
jgi:hypothetical protein